MKKQRSEEDTESLLHRGSHDSDAEYASDAEVGGVKPSSSHESGSTASRHHSFNPMPHVFNLANCIVGVSVLAMPFCFQQCGILLAVLMIGFCSVLTKWTCYFLSKASFMSKKRSYEALALAAFGNVGRRFIEFCLLFFLVSSIIAFMVVIGDIGPHVVADYLDLEAPTSKLRTLVMVLVLLFVIFPLAFINDLEKFSVVSSLAIFFYAIFVVRMVVEAMPVLWEGKWSVSVVWWRPAGFLKCLPIIFMAMSCQTQLFCVMDCIKDVTSFKVDVVVSHAINSCSAMYAAVGLFGYVAFYSKELHGDVLVELLLSESSLFTQILKLAFMLSIAVSIPLMLFPARSALFNLLLRPSGCELPMAAIERSTFHILSFVILVSNLMVALVIPNVEFILGLTGSLIGSMVSTIIPSLVFIYIGQRKGHPSVNVAKACLVVGVFVLLASTWATLEAERRTTVVEKPMPKDSVMNEPALKSLERLEERVLDSNLNISAKLDDIAGLAAKGDQKEAARLIVEMKEQQEEQVKLIKKQEQIVEELNKHIDKHKQAHDETELEKKDNATEEVIVVKSAEQKVEPKEKVQESQPPPVVNSTSPPQNNTREAEKSET